MDLVWFFLDGLVADTDLINYWNINFFFFLLNRCCPSALVPGYII
jgi:hypothetical protein